jgi:hypothetical protein
MYTWHWSGSRAIACQSPARASPGKDGEEMPVTPIESAETWTAWHRRSRRERWKLVYTGAATEAEAWRWTLHAGLGGDTCVCAAGVDPNNRRPLASRGREGPQR